MTTTAASRPKAPAKPRARRVDVAGEFMEAMREAVAIMHGEAQPARVTVSVDPKAIREGLGLSQPAFAERFGLNVAAVREWEQGRRRPDPAARALLKVIARHPDIVAEAIAA